MDFQSQSNRSGAGENARSFPTSNIDGSNNPPKEPVVSISQGTNFKSAFSDDHRLPKVEEKSSKIIALLDSIITISLSALFFGLPIFFTGLTLQGISFEKQIYFYFWILLAAVAWVSKGVIVGEMKIKKTPLDIPIVLFWLASAISLVFSVDRWHSFWGFFGDPSRGFMSITAMIIEYYIVTSHFNKKRFLLASGLMVVADFMLALWATFGLLGIQVVPEKIGQFIPLSPVGSLTGLGIFLGAMLPLIIVFILNLFSENKDEARKGNAKKIAVATALFVTLLLNMFVLLALYSFVAWLGILVGISFFLIYILAQIVRPAENWTWLPMVMFVAVLSFLIIGSNSIARVQLPVEVNPGYQLSWEIARESLRDNLLVGSGLATYGYDFSLHKPQSFNLNPYYNLRFFQGAGVFFEALSTMGIVGTITLVLLVLTFVSIGVYLLSIDKQKNKLFSLGLFAASIIVIVNSFSGKIEGALLILGVLLTALTVSMLLFESESEENHLSLSLKASPKYALALAFVFMVVSAGVVFLFVFVGKIYAADLRAGSAMRQQKITADGSVSKLAGAIAWNNRESRYYVLLGQELMSLANEETLKGEKDRNLGLIQDYLNNSISAVNQARNLSPKDIAAVEALAQIYENSGLYVADSFSLANDNYKKALALEPHNPIYWVKIGQIEMAQASTKKTPEEARALVEQAKTSFQKAIDEKNNLAAAHYQLALTNETLGNLDGAIKSIEQAAVLEQNNLNYIYNAARIHQVRGNEEDNKIAEAIYKNILSNNDKEINTLFSLGLLYEKTKRSSDATVQYKKVLEILPQENAEVRAKVQKMISNIAAGIENKPENLNTEVVSSPEDVQITAPQPTDGVSAAIPINP
jgi:tetratricopeptide (TPR) repeat protein